MLFVYFLFVCYATVYGYFNWFKKITVFSSISVLQELAFIKNLPVSVQTIFATFIFNLAGVPPFLGWLLKSLVVSLQFS